jgi:hypothetical protein
MKVERGEEVNIRRNKSNTRLTWGGEIAKGRFGVGSR